MQRPRVYDVATRIQIPIALPKEYQVTIVAEPKSTVNGFVLGLGSEGNPFNVLLNYAEPNRGPVSAIENIDGHRVTRNETTHDGEILKIGKRSTIVCTVRKAHVNVVCDGKTIIDWSGNPSRLSRSPYWKVPRLNQPFIGAYNCIYHIHSATLESLSDEADSQNVQPE